MALARLYRSAPRVCKILNNINTPSHEVKRTLFSREILGLDSYQRFASVMNDRLRDVKDKFIPRMEEYMTNEQNAIFTDDLKNIIALADTDTDFTVLEQMIKRYYTQSSESVLKQFSFGPVIMRMLHNKSKVDMALSLYQTAELSGMFPQISCCIVLMDMLYENQRYSEALDIFANFIENRRASTDKFIIVYPRDIITITCACYYKLNSAESLANAKKFLSDLTESGGNITNRGAAFVAMLSLNQNDPGYGYEIVGSLRSQRPANLKNLKIQCQVKLGRFDEAVMLLGSILHYRTDNDAVRGKEVFPDTLAILESSLRESGDEKLLQNYLTMQANLESGGHVSFKTLKEFNEETVRHPRGRHDQPGFAQGSGEFNRRDGDQRFGDQRFTDREMNQGRTFNQPWRRPAFLDQYIEDEHTEDGDRFSRRNDRNRYDNRSRNDRNDDRSWNDRNDRSWNDRTDNRSWNDRNRNDNRGRWGEGERFSRQRREGDFGGDSMPFSQQNNNRY